MARSNDDRRRELAEFLRCRRERVRPGDVGLPLGSNRRRVVGLRREEVAILAGVSPTWYTYLEQGRAIQVSPQVLDSLSRVLALNEDERRYLHRLSYGYVAGPLDVTADEVDQYVALLATIESEWPVYVADAMCDLVTWNAPTTQWYTDWNATGQQPNMLVWLVTDPLARERVPEWDLVGRDLMARSRAAIALYPSLYDERIDRMQQMMREYPQLTSWWSDRHVTELRPVPRILVHPQLGARRFLLRTFLSAMGAGTGIVFHVPDDSPSP